MFKIGDIVRVVNAPERGRYVIIYVLNLRIGNENCYYTIRNDDFELLTLFVDNLILESEYLRNTNLNILCS